MNLKKKNHGGKLAGWLAAFLLCLMMSVAGDLCVPALPVTCVETAYAVTFKKRVPVLTEATAAADSVSLTWKKVKDAKEYEIYRRSGDGVYKVIGTSKVTNYKDLTALPGITYTYTVRGTKPSGTSVVRTSYDPVGLEAMVPIPVVEVKSVAMSGVKANLKWKTLKNVDGYIIYRKVNDGSYYTAKTITKGTTASWKDANVEVGNTYTYAVRAYVNDGDVVRKGPYYDRGVTILVPPEIPELQAVEPFSGRTLVRWSPVEAATGYYVYRRIGDGSYSKVATVNGLDFYRDNGVKAGKTYTYAVRSYINKDGTSAKSKYQELSVVVEPEGVQMLSLTTNKKKTKDTFSWTSVSGVNGYNIYKKNADTKNKWKLTDSVAASVNTYTIERYKGGVSSYAVRPYVKVDGKKLLSKVYDELSNAEQKYKTSTILFEGDSITKGYTWGAGIAEVSYPVRVGQLTGSRVENHAVSNATLASRSDSNANSIWQRVVGVYGESSRPGTWKTEIVPPEESQEPETSEKSTEMSEPEESSFQSGDQGDPDDAASRDAASGVEESSSENIGDQGDPDESGNRWPSFPLKPSLAADQSLENMEAVAAVTVNAVRPSAADFSKEAFLKDYGNYDVICLAGGTNDWNYRVPIGHITDFRNDTFLGAWNEIFDRLLCLKEYRKNLKVVLITPTYRGRYNNDYTIVGYDAANGRGSTLQDYTNAIYAIRDKYQNELDIYVYDSGAAGVINESNYLTSLFDSLHPTRETYTKMGLSIADFLKKNVLTMD